MDAGAASADRIPRVVAALASGLSVILRNRLIALYLGGSYSMGDFVAATSDYDLLIITDDDLTGDDLAALGVLHERLLRDDSEASRFEGDYVPRRLLVPEGTSEPVPRISHGRFEPVTREIMLSADNIANMRSDGFALYGPPASEILPLVTPRDVRAAILRMVLEKGDECPAEAAAASALLNLARSLCALESGRPTTKSEGVAWALEHLDPRWQLAIREANAIRRGKLADETEVRLRAAVRELDEFARSTFEGTQC
ncbi:MAG TPA: aminoglycoside adenylyltransferase domain-containing protein [Chloroflexota bacterium]|nr:aminoglycoside adenylyltransferase domain-containing protein [Chloroflexota bacterium]